MSRFIRTALVMVGLFGLLGLGSLSVSPAAYAASPSTDAAKADACTGVGGTIDANGKCQTDSASLNDIIANVVNFLSILIGIVSVIMIMVGGFKYVTANGDSNSVSSAKSTIIYAVIGLVITAFAQSIVKFVLHKTIK